MKKKDPVTCITLLLFTWFLSSCATILNSTTQQVTIAKDSSIKSITVDSLHYLGKLNGEYLLKRSPKPLTLHVKVDSVEKDITIKSHNSLAYYLNIYPWCLPGFFIDDHKPKRYAYAKTIYLEKKDTVIKIRHAEPVQKGLIDWVFALPYVNNFNLKTTDKNRNSTGFWGIETGVDYYYKKNTYLSLFGGAATDFFLPVLAPVDYSGEIQSSTTAFISLRNNIRLGSLDVGYGLSFSQLNWHIKNTYDSTFIPRSKVSNGIGLSLIASYRISKDFRIGLLYQPRLFDFKASPAFNYQHSISLEIICKTPLLGHHN